jgi:hypothetical protein
MVTRRYLLDTKDLETTFTTESKVVRLVDLMPILHAQNGTDRLRPFDHPFEEALMSDAFGDGLAQLAVVKCSGGSACADHLCRRPGRSARDEVP